LAVKFLLALRRRIFENHKMPQFLFNEPQNDKSNIRA
jgi:hypothetical protein